MNKVITFEGDSVGRILFRYCQHDDDQLERDFYRVNPEISKYGPVLPSGLQVIIPSMKQPQQQTKQVIRVWH